MEIVKINQDGNVKGNQDVNVMGNHGMEMVKTNKGCKW